MKERRGPIAAPGYRFILTGIVITLLGLWLGALVLILGLVTTGFFAFFFRDPERPVPSKAGLVVAPADGRVIALERQREEFFLKQPAQKISIFMNIFDVHVNRAPVLAQVLGLYYQPGQYLAANRPEAPAQNEQLAVHLRTPEQEDVVMVQIAGLLARRIISYLQEGGEVARGERVGLICFGSRVDLYLPESYQIQVNIGQKVKAGSSILGRRS
ncbi:MAG: phosphatidylserine decarboxylase family protein [Desulfobacca sp.]|uniref:phosphatidylserine decarboxylase family protein n=1 Tax=Desulfobacca sp. TaxID=2067990 RepID=UPI00404A36B0